MLETVSEAVPAQALVHSLNNLQTTHNRLIEKPAESPSNCYALNVRQYLKPSPAAVNRQALVQSVIDKCDPDPYVVGVAYEMVLDHQLMADFHAMAWQDAQEQALATLSRVCNEYLPSEWQANPSADGGQIRLSADGHVTFTVHKLLRDAAYSVDRAVDQGDQTAICALNRVGQALAAIDRAFKSAAVVLLSYDIEDNMANLMTSEVDAVLMA